MARDISVSIAVQGEREFNQALKNAQSAVKVLASELKASEAAFDENADTQAYFANRTRLINAQIDQQRTILSSLEQAVREAAEEFGDASTKTDKYRIELNKTSAEISKMERALREAQQEAEEFGRDSTRVGRQLEDGIGEAADNVTDKLEDMTRKIEADLSDIGGAVQFSAFKDAFDMATGAMEAVTGFVENTEEYRRQLSFLEQNAADHGFDFSYIKGQLFEIASLTGDADGAFEAISNLMAAGFDGKELEEAIDLIGGAVIRFPETMKFENLAESLQESVKSGSATGAYAELLERLGVDLETVNKSLEKATTEEERQQIALAYLNGHGLKDTVENYSKMNEDLIANETAQLKFNDAVSNLGEALLPASTAWTNFKTGVVNGLTEMIEGYKAWEEQYNKEWEDLRGVVKEAQEDSTTFTSVEEYTEAIAQADAEGAYARANALAAERDRFLKEQLERTSQELTEASSQDAQTIGENISTGVGNGIVESEGNATGAATGLWESIKNILGRTVTVPVEVAQTGGSKTGGTVTASSRATGGRGDTVTVITKIDGDRVAASTTSGVSSRQAQQASRDATYA